MRVGGIVLAAGEGRRFGAETKQLADLDGRPLLEHALAAVAGLSPRVVVLGHAAAEIRAVVDLQGARPVVCADWADGQSASVRAGIDALGDVDAVLLLLGDMPHVTRAAVDAVAAASLDGADAARAAYAGRPGHPVKLGRGLLERAGELRGDAGFRELLKGARIRDIEVGELGDPADVDTPEDLAGVCGGSLPPMVGDRLTGADLTLDEAVAALERGEQPPLTPLQQRMVEEHAARR